MGLSSPASGRYDFEYLMSPQQPVPVDRSGTVQDARTFFVLTGALALSQAEECALLDVERTDLVLLRDEPAKALEAGGAKLQHRLDYALALLIRMKTALEC